MYEKMLQYAKEHHLELEGYAYEMGLNDLVIQDETRVFNGDFDKD